MTKVIAFHSFHSGTGTSNILTSTAALLAKRGLRVGILDTDLQSPSAYVFFGLENGWAKGTLNDYLWGDIPVENVICDVTEKAGEEISGKILLCPASPEVAKVMRILREGYDISKLTKCFSEFSKAYDLDYLVVDTASGLSEETLLALAVSDAVVVVLRLDHQDYLGTAITIDLIRDMANAELIFIVNDISSLYSPEDVNRQVSQVYGLEPFIIIPHTEEMLTLASSGIFSIRYPEHMVTGLIRFLAEKLSGL
ncbi:MAG: MinD/ParA family protein [Anaerolineales bacterium]|nr:MinD/ParA family protein [Anaerolineales bacterium]